jgi:hypothetical protein
MNHAFLSASCLFIVRRGEVGINVICGAARLCLHSIPLVPLLLLMCISCILGFASFQFLETIKEEIDRKKSRAIVLLSK